VIIRIIALHSSQQQQANNRDSGQQVAGEIQYLFIKWIIFPTLKSLEPLLLS